MSDTPPVTPKALRPLELLRDRVEVAAEEITRLRQENAELARRVAALEAEHPLAVGEGGVLLDVDEPPETLKRKITGFIEHVDALIAQEQTRRQAAEAAQANTPADTPEAEAPSTD